MNQTFHNTQQPEKRTWITPELQLISSDDILFKTPNHTEGYYVGGFGITGALS